MKSLAFAPSSNTPGKADGTWFQAKAKLWQKRHGGKVVHVDMSRPKPTRFHQILRAIREERPDAVAFFCHALRRGLPQFGARGSLLDPEDGDNVATLAGEIGAASASPLVCLFACSAGDDLVPGPAGAPGGDGGFADALRDAVVKWGSVGVRVFAHDRKGDTTANPHVRVFDGPEQKDRVGGRWVVVPPGLTKAEAARELAAWGDSHDAVQWKRWVRWVRDGGWVEFPLLSVEDSRSRLVTLP